MLRIYKNVYNYLLNTLSKWKANSLSKPEYQEDTLSEFSPVQYDGKYFLSSSQNSHEKPMANNLTQG